MEYGIEASLLMKADLASRNKLKTLFRLSLKHGDIHRRDLSREAAQVKPDFKGRMPAESGKEGIESLKASTRIDKRRFIPPGSRVASCFLDKRQ